jgi:hypothetical protein
MKKKGAMEMSVGTIVTIVLLMSVLILGIFLIQRIFSSAQSVLDMTDEQLRDELRKLFSSEETKVVIFPPSQHLEIEHEERDAIGLAIKNLAKTGSGTNEFGYKIKYTEGSGNCPRDVDPLSWIIVGKEESDIPLLVGEMYFTRVVFEIPLGTPLCTARFRVDTSIDDEWGYKSTFFDISVQG